MNEDDILYVDPAEYAERSWDADAADFGTWDDAE